MNAGRFALVFAAVVVVGSLAAENALAAMGGPLWRQRETNRVPAPPAAARTPTARPAYSTMQSYSGSRSGWNASNTWYNVPSYGNYAPPPYATSRSAFYQVGPVPAFGGVRSLPGWGGAR
jgi:hypothetical protein